MHDHSPSHHWECNGNLANIYGWWSDFTSAGEEHLATIFWPLCEMSLITLFVRSISFHTRWIIASPGFSLFMVQSNLEIALYMYLSPCELHMMMFLWWLSPASSSFTHIERSGDPWLVSYMYVLTSTVMQHAGIWSSGDGSRTEGKVCIMH